MQVLNIHEREIAAAGVAVGALIDSLASADDRLWPRTMWPPMRFDHPLGVGTSGGHGPIGHAIEPQHLPAEVRQGPATAANAAQQPPKLAEMALQTIQERLARHRGSRRALADELGVSERTLYRRLKTLARS